MSFSKGQTTVVDSNAIKEGTMKVRAALAVSVCLSIKALKLREFIFSVLRACVCVRVRMCVCVCVCVHIMYL